jgi:hypothetical protein
LSFSREILATERPAFHLSRGWVPGAEHEHPERVASAVVMAGRQ